MSIKLPAVELLAAELAKGMTPVDLYGEYVDAISQMDPPTPAEDLPKIRAELKARIQFAWQSARGASIRARLKRPA